MKKCVMCDCCEIDHFSIEHEPMGTVERKYIDAEIWKAAIKEYPIERYICLDCGYTYTKVSNIEAYREDMKYFQMTHDVLKIE